MTTEIHRDDLASKTGMWLFLFTEMLLFGGLFVVYSVYRYRNPMAFHLAAHELSVAIGTINTIILLISSSTIAMSITALQKQNKKLALLLLGTTVILGLAFLVNKYFEWGEHIKEHIYPGSPVLALRGQGDVLFMAYIFL
jgi:cytochrome c oxidase subunit 3